MNIDELKVLAGISNKPNWQPYNVQATSMSGNEKAKIMQEKKIRPGDPDWFRLWFARPWMTGESNT